MESVGFDASKVEILLEMSKSERDRPNPWRLPQRPLSEKLDPSLMPVGSTFVSDCAFFINTARHKSPKFYIPSQGFYAMKNLPDNKIPPSPIPFLENQG